MTYKRSPSARFGPGGTPTMAPSPNALHGNVCDTCRWPLDCMFENVCWAAEKLDIATERAAHSVRSGRVPI